MINKSHHKFIMDITQMIHRNIQIHNHLTSKISKKLIQTKTIRGIESTCDK